MSIKKAIIILIIVTVVGIIIVAVVASRKTEIEYTTAPVMRGKIIQTVSETGTVKAADEINLSFVNSGRIAKVNYKIGDEVKVGTILAELDYNDLEIKKNELNANVDVAKQSLNKLLSGATASEIAVSKAGVDQARIAYEAAQNELEKISQAANEKISQAEKTLADLNSSAAANITATEQAVITAQTSLDNTKSTYQNTIDNYSASALVAIEDKLANARTALDTINRVLTDEDAEDQLSKKNPIYLSLTSGSYNEAMSLVETAESSLALAKANNTNDNIMAAFADSSASLSKVFTSLSYCFSALENSITSSGFTQAELDTFKTNISTQQTTIGTSLSSIQTAEQNLSGAILDYDTKVSAAEDALVAAQAALSDAKITAQNALATARLSAEQTIASAESKVNTTREAWTLSQAQYNKLIAPANQYDIGLERAKVRQAEAAYNSITNQIENSIIISPIDGTITKINYEVGEQSTLSGGPVISILGSSQYEIEVLISEADIAKVSVADKVMVTLDSFGDDVEFSGEVNFIEPAETVIQDVIYYQIDMIFDPGEAAVKSGMTANVTITTAEKDNILTIPSRAIVTRNGSGKFARVLINNEIQEKPITTGLRGDGGTTEVVSGLNEGEKVVTQIKNGK